MKPETNKYLKAVSRRLRTERSVFGALLRKDHACFLQNLQWREANTRSIQRLSGEVSQ